MLTKDKRIFYFDELRSFAIICVVLCHVCQGFKTIDLLHSPTLLSYLCIGRMGVPLFFMLSGALLINRDYTLLDFFKKRFFRVLIPALFCLFISGLIYFSYSGFDIYWYYDTGFSWFIYAIIGVYLVIPIFNSFVKEYGMSGVEYCLVFWLILIILLNINFNSQENVVLIFENYGKYIGYAILGYFLANKDFNIYSLPMIIFNLIIFIVCFAINWYMAITYVNIVQIDSISMIIQCSALFLVLRYLSKYAQFNSSKMLSKFHYFIQNSFIGKIIYLLSICSYTIFLIHISVFWRVVSYFPLIYFDNIPLVLFLCVSLSFIISLVIYKIPILNKLMGIG